MQSVMTHNFSQVPKAEIPRSSFDRSHGLKTTFDAGYLVPVFVDEALPGDTFNLNMSVFARLATPIRPFMDNLFLDSFFFAVPYRLVWDNFQRFNGEQVNPGDSTDFLIPQMVSPEGGYAIGSLSDYFGLPTVGQVGASNTVSHSSLWHRAYNLIWNEWFRDQNLQNSVTVDKGDGPDDPANYTLLRRGKRHDYFTSCLPWPQKGASVPLPLTGNAPVLPGAEHTTGSVATGMKFRGTAAGIQPTTYPYMSSGVMQYCVSGSPSAPSSASPIYPSNLYADLSSVTAATVNSLRQAFQLQRLSERDARGGTRYTEIVRAHFGVVSPDARLQRPEYLGGGSTPVNINPIAQTTATVSGQTPQGNLAAMGTIKATGHGFTKSFTEHCLLIGLVCVRADLTYQQGMPRMFSRRTRFEHYWPALAGLGEQAVLNKEIYCDGSANDALVFGYQERYAEYRYKPSVITGKFRSTYATPLDVWHLSQKFTALPALGASFIEENPPISRVIAVTSEPQFLFDSFFSLKCARPMPVFGVPGLIDHF
nr:MAG: major capsid protein [Microvirus sp.]